MEEIKTPELESPAICLPAGYRVLSSKHKVIAGEVFAFSVDRTCTISDIRRMLNGLEGTCEVTKVDERQDQNGRICVYGVRTYEVK
jgi:hypothetical protein